MLATNGIGHLQPDSEQIHKQPEQPASRVRVVKILPFFRVTFRATFRATFRNV